MEASIANEIVLILLASDGAGSAKYGRLGAQVTSLHFAKEAVKTLKSSGSVEAICDDDVARWLDKIRDQIYQAAQKRGAQPRDFAATLVACVIAPNSALIVHVGDGACVARFGDSEEWEVVSWPEHGEYASTTTFVTDEPSPPFRSRILHRRISEVAVFTDGLERLVLDFNARKAHQPFFRKMFGTISNQPAGRHRQYSKALGSFLGSPEVVTRTDDDKTLIFAHRVTG